jgi:hypothetical protein
MSYVPVYTNLVTIYLLIYGLLKNVSNLDTLNDQMIIEDDGKTVEGSSHGLI